jgi:hypothetical protein
VRSEFSESSRVELVGELDNRWSSVVENCCHKKVVAEAEYGFGTQRKVNVRRWKPLPSNG